MYQIQTIYIKNYKSIQEEILDFWANKSVLVWKNDTWKTNFLKAIRCWLNHKKIKKSDFLDKKNRIEIKIIFRHKEQHYEILLKSKIINDSVKTDIVVPPEIEEYYNKTQIVYIPSDRKYKKKDKKSGYHTLINLILENKTHSNLEKIYLDKINGLWNIAKLSASKNTTLLISLLELYLHTIKHAKNEWFKIFILDQPENFLHPHATKLIDNLLLKISALQNTQIFYSTHSPDLVANFKKNIYELSDVVFVHRENNYSKAKKLKNPNRRYNKIMINLIFKNASIFFSDAVILVEGETERVALPNIYENWDWKHEKLHIKQDDNNFNLELKNINIIDVWGKWALAEWYSFSCEIFWKDNVFAMIDKDPDYEEDKQMIIRTIKKVHRIDNVYENQFKDYNWIVLDWEFESYYKKSVIKQFLEETILERSEKFWDQKYPQKIQENIEILDYRMAKLKQSKKISKEYAKLFKKYFSKYWKPTIAFNLSTYLSKNKWYKSWIIENFKFIIEKLEK